MGKRTKLGLSVLVLTISLFLSFKNPSSIKADPGNARIDVTYNITAGYSQNINVVPLGERFEAQINVSGFEQDEYWLADAVVIFDKDTPNEITINLLEDSSLPMNEQYLYTLVDVGSGSHPLNGSPITYAQWVDSLPNHQLAVGNSNGFPLTVNVAVDDSALKGGHTVTVGFVRNDQTENSLMGVGDWEDIYSDPTTIYFINGGIYFPIPFEMTLGEEYQDIDMIVFQLPASAIAGQPSYFRTDLLFYVDEELIDPTSDTWNIKVDDGTGNGYVAYGDWIDSLVAANGGFAIGNGSLKISIQPKAGDTSLVGDHTLYIFAVKPSEFYDYSDQTTSAGAWYNWFPSAGIGGYSEFTVVAPAAPAALAPAAPATGTVGMDLIPAALALLALAVVYKRCKD